jgi:hypothetical protein
MAARATPALPAPCRRPRRPNEAMLLRLCQFLNDSSIGTQIRESIFVFPLIETVHVLAIALLVGTIAILDLRLLGIVLKSESVSELAAQILPVTWIGFGIMFVSGFLLFWAEAAKSYSNPAFRLKLVLLALVGLNPLVFHTTVYRKVADWDQSPVTPRRARATAILSLSLWAAIITAGRAIAYFH